MHREAATMAPSPSLPPPASSSLWLHGEMRSPGPSGSVWPVGGRRVGRGGGQWVGVVRRRSREGRGVRRGRYMKHLGEVYMFQGLRLLVVTDRHVRSDVINRAILV